MVRYGRKSLADSEETGSGVATEAGAEGERAGGGALPVPTY